MRFFNNLNDYNIEKEYNDVEIDYREAFWELFDKCKLFNKLSDLTFNKILHLDHVSPYHIFTKKNIVNKYGEVLREYIKQNTFMVRLLVDAYEQDYTDNHKKIYLPDELTNEEICECLSTYIDSKEANFNVLDSIFRMRETKRFPISDEIRLRASNRYEKKKGEIGETGIRAEHGVQLIFSEEQIEPKKIETKENTIIATYSKEWLLDSLDYPSILNNFIYIFEYVDIWQMRCNLVSKKVQASIFEDVFGTKKLSCYYQLNSTFNLKNMIAQMQMSIYYDFLNQQSIRYEDVLKFFFTEYLQEEFACSNISVLLPSEGTSYYEKCTILCSTFDSLLKQFTLYVKHKKIDPKLVSISSNSVKFSQIPSLMENKYLYGNGEAFDQITSLMFSDQCRYSYIKRISDKKCHYDTLFELLKNEEVYLSDYREQEKPVFTLLEEKDLISISPDGKLSLGDLLKVYLLKDLYDNEVISRYSYSLEADKIFKQWLDEGIVRCGDGLFSEPEVNYLNYILNHAEYVNGLDLRNKYSHGVQMVLDERVHKQNYYIFLIVLTILAIKINDDFILNEKQKKEFSIR